jgi:uncharacterized membrane protein YphA (DoxX/SURF4 family)
MQEEVILEERNQRVALEQTPVVTRQEMPLMQTISLAARLVLGVVFLVAGAEKLTALDQFAHAISNYQLVPVSMVNIAALLFVWTEIAVGVMLIAGAAVRGNALVAGAMLLVFIVAILSAMARGLEIDCGCFVAADGSAGEKVGWPKIFEDVGLLAAALFLVYFPKSYFALDNLLRREAKTQASI